MAENSPQDDLRTIRRIMERTRRSVGETGGRFMVLWGSIWFVGFLGNQWLAPPILGWFWLALTAVGTVCSAVIGVAARRRTGVRSPVWRLVGLWLISMMGFAALMIWLLGLRTTREVAVVIVLTVALTYIQVGLVGSWPVAAVGALLAGLTVAAHLIVPDSFFMAMAFLSGGLLVGSGMWFIRQEARG